MFKLWIIYDLTISVLTAHFRAPDPIGAHYRFRCFHLALGRVRLGFQGAPLQDVGCDMCPGALWGGVGASILCSRACTPGCPMRPMPSRHFSRPPPPNSSLLGRGPPISKFHWFWHPQHRQLVLVAPSGNVQMSLPILEAGRQIIVFLARGALQCRLGDGISAGGFPDNSRCP